MKAKHIAIVLGTLALLAGGASLLTGQQKEITGVITSAERPAIAITDMRGAGDAQKYMDTFNATLWSEVSNAGILKMIGKGFYPTDRKSTRLHSSHT